MGRRDDSEPTAPVPAPRLEADELDDTAQWSPPPPASWGEEITVRTTLDLLPLPTPATEVQWGEQTMQVLESMAGSATDTMEWRSAFDDASDTLSGGEDPDGGQRSVVGSAITHKGLVREGNEDAYLVWPEANLMVVADGMGGHKAGEVASALTVESIREALLRAGTLPNAFSAQRLLVETVQEAHANIRERAEADEGLAGMGTTVVALWVFGGKGLVVHVGDSRLYRLRGGLLRQVTRDHSLLEELQQFGILEPEKAASDPRRHVLTRALGGQAELEVDAAVIDLRVGDRYLLCTDGLKDIVSDGLIRDLLLPPRSVGLSARSLVEAALAHGGKDNVTVVVVEVGEG